MQRDPLPLLIFATDRVVISAAPEPAFNVGGDTSDYAGNGGTVDLTVLDAVGHGLPAAMLAVTAVGNYRHARRNGWTSPT